MLTVWDRAKVTAGYIGLRLNNYTHADGVKWADVLKTYYSLRNSNASDEVIDHYWNTAHNAET